MIKVQAIDLSDKYRHCEEIRTLIQKYIALAYLLPEVVKKDFLKITQGDSRQNGYTLLGGNRTGNFKFKNEDKGT